MKIKLDWEDFFTGLALIGVVSIVVFIGAYFGGFRALGLFSYNGLSKQQVDRSFAEFQKKYPVISKVSGNLLGFYFERGIAGSGGPIYYFHYWTDRKNFADFQIYPEFLETWSTDPGLLGIGKAFTGSQIYPN